MTADVTTPAQTTQRRRGPFAGLRQKWAPGPFTTEATALTIITLILVVFGLVMSFSASFVDGARAGDPFAGFRRQLLWALVGIPVFALSASLHHRIWRRLSWLLLIVSLAALVLVLVPGIGLERFGATRWIGSEPFVVQPSEIAKLGLLLWLADVLERKRPRDGSLHQTKHLTIPALPMVVVMAVLVLLQPDLGTTILLALIVGAVLWVEGLAGRWVALALGGCATLVAGLAIVAPYRMARIRGWLWPEQYPLDEGFQLLQSWYALGSGGWFGMGLGSSRGKWDFIPNPETDFIFAIIGEETGLVGSLAVLALFSGILYFGLKTAYASPDLFGRTVALGVTAWIVGQALVNIGTVTGLLPITGVTLPLLSAGGSSLVSTLVALGILVSIARRPQAAPRTAQRRRPSALKAAVDQEKSAAAKKDHGGGS